jgi:hypothetical protein
VDDTTVSREIDQDTDECRRCGGPRDRVRRGWARKWATCKACHAAYMRLNRPSHSELTDEQRLKANARSYANVYRRKGKLIPQRCEVCGSHKVEMHHDDYGKPLNVRWFCRSHHVQLERIARSVAAGR